jgi:hypothetical protein
LRDLAKKAEFDLRRMRFDYVSASNVQRFDKIVIEFIDQVKALGPSPLSGNKPEPNLLLNLRAAKAAAEGFRLRVLAGKEEQLVSKGNVYGERSTLEKFDEVMAEAVDSEYARHRIRLALLEKSMSVLELSEKLDMEPRRILEHLVAMRLLGWVDTQEIRGRSPIYRALEVP